MTNIAIEHGPYIVDLPILKVVILQFAKPTSITGRLVFSTGDLPLEEASGKSYGKPPC